MNKVVRDGMVAVLYSPGYGAGWFTWNDKQELLFDPVLVERLEAKDLGGVEERAKEIQPNGYWGGKRDLKIMWLPEGTNFRVSEYDGFETIDTEDDLVIIA